MLSFDFLEKGVGLVFSPYSMHDFSRIIFFMLYSIDSPNFNFWLPLFLEILGNIWTVIFWLPGYDVINFEVSFDFLMKPLSQMSELKFKYRQNKKNFFSEVKSIFNHFWRAFSCQKSSQSCECAFKCNNNYGNGCKVVKILHRKTNHTY